MFKKKHSWYWNTIWILLFCCGIFLISKFFMKAINSIANKTKSKKRKPEYEVNTIFI